MGVVIRDSRGMVIAAECRVLSEAYNAKFMEALAVEEGILLARDLEPHQIVVESDSIGVVYAINANNCNRDIGSITQGTLELPNSLGARM